MIRIGCSGWQYQHWRDEFYPAELPQSRWFAHYMLSFDTVEINNSFYRLPEARTFAKWRDQAPRRFLYAVKASRFLTHMKKLKDPEEPIARFFDRAKHLRSHLGPVLYQLPPHWPIDLPRFEHFLAVLPRGSGILWSFGRRAGMMSASMNCYAAIRWRCVSMTWMARHQSGYSSVRLSMSGSITVRKSTVVVTRMRGWITGQSGCPHTREKGLMYSPTSTTTPVGTLLATQSV